MKFSAFLLFIVCQLPLWAVAEEVKPKNIDPWQGFNQGVFAFNDTADRYFMQPVAKGYQFITPTFLDNGISNIFSTIAEIPTSINALLQFKPLNVGKSLGRFAINATLGLFGFFDVATRMGIEEQEEDFGQTLAVWGVPAGPYVVLPFLGPSTLRDAVGLVPDYQLAPVAAIDDVATRNTLAAIKYIDMRADLLEIEGLISGDRYTFIRNAYLQQREYLILDGNVEDDFGESELDDDWLEDDF